MRIPAIALLGLLVLAGGGCGSRQPSPGHALGVVIDAVPGDQVVNAVDLAAARRQLRLPADAGVLPAAGQDRDELQLRTVAAIALPFLGRLDPAVVKDIDLHGLRQAASGGLTTQDRVTAMRFDGAAGDVLQKLAAAGWRRRGELFESPGPSPSRQFAGQGRDELVLLSSSRRALQQARMGKAPGGLPRRLVQSLHEPVRVAASLGNSGCLAGVGGGDQVQPPSGRLVATPKGKPDPGRLARAKRLGRTRLLGGEVSGGRVIARFTGAEPAARGQIGLRFLQQFRFADVYRC